MTGRQTPETFWSHVTRGKTNECWNWIGARTSSGYGNVAWWGMRVQAHRVAYWLTYGGIDLTTRFRVAGVAKQYAQFVLHRCDNRLCCNPAHLFLGTMRENQLDAYAKGRRKQPQSRHANAKVLAHQIRSIRRLYHTKRWRQVDLAERFGVSQHCISLIVRGETYKDIT